ncbi:MAG: hypothetical protein JKY54_10670 [Flavobacteriales bacterium]|nr:hypothetical protein [Flavobacteriales bacterium]
MTKEKRIETTFLLGLLTIMGMVHIIIMKRLWVIWSCFHSQRILFYRYVVFESGNPADSEFVEICYHVLTGVGEMPNYQIAKLYPNPANSSVRVKLPNVEMVGSRFMVEKLVFLIFQ